MTRFLPGLALVASVLAASTASAQLGPPPDPLNDWVDACHATDPDLQALVEHNALIISAGALIVNLDGSYHVNTTPFTRVVFPQADPYPPLLFDMCPQSRFYGQAQVVGQSSVAADISRRSAVQVGPDLVLTTWHNPFNPIYLPDYLVVFGLHARDVGGSCVFPDLGNIPASQVYSLEAVVADGWPDGLDMLLLRLNRVVSDHYPRVRRSGRGWPGDDIAAIGHPQRLAAKVDRAGKAGKTQITPAGQEWLDVEKVHLLPDSSGSMVYNRTQRVLETAAKQGLGLTLDWVPPQACYVLKHLPGFAGRNASLRHFAQHIPAFELVVDSLDPVVHVAALGGGINPPNSRTIKAPLTAAGALDYEIVPPGPAAPGQPSLSIVASGPLAGTLSPGAQLSVQETANIHGVTCGFHERSYEIRDLTNGFVDLARHVFEIGIREFTVGGFERSLIRDLAPPFETQLEYPVINPRPTPVVVRVTASANWLKLDTVEPGGPMDPPASVDRLVAAHDSIVVKVGIAGWAASLPYSLPGEPYDATVSFQVAPGDPCPTVGGTVTREIDFEYGTEEIAGSGGITIPQGGVIVGVDVNEDFCIGDVDLRIHTTGVSSDHIEAHLTSPPSDQCFVWNGGILSPPGPLRATLDDDGAMGTVPPYEPLGIFDNTQGGGTWKFHIATVGSDPDPGGDPWLESWSLVLKAKQCP